MLLRVGDYLGQLWLFWVAPLLGAAIAGSLTRWMYEQEKIGTAGIGAIRNALLAIMKDGQFHKSFEGRAAAGGLLAAE